MNRACAVDVEMPAVRSGPAGMTGPFATLGAAFVGGAVCEASVSSGGSVWLSRMAPRLAALAPTRGEAAESEPLTGATSTEAAVKLPTTGTTASSTSTPSSPADVDPVALVGTGAAEAEVCAMARNDPGSARATATAAPS